LLENVQTWKRYWIVTLANGRRIPQFNPSTGTKLEWKDLPDKPVQVDLVPFSPELAAKVQLTGIFAVPMNAKPIQAIGGGLLPVRDTYYVMKRLAVCAVCNDHFEWESPEPPVCPSCGAKDEWLCHKCDGKEADKMGHCPTCKAGGHTVGPKKIQKIGWTQATLYETHYIMRFQCSAPTEIEIRETDEAIQIHGRYPEGVNG
jgi:predicted RNA-binding Zn-ribbon protein involved in translation (DUF1610 family)